MYRIKYLLLAALLTCPLPSLGAGGGSAPTPYFNIATPFVVNLADKEDLVFLQVNAQFKVPSEELKPHLTTHMPAIQHTMMLVLSQQTTKDIKTVAGKEKLRATALKAIQDLLKEQVGDPIIEEVYFTGFIIQ